MNNDNVSLSPMAAVGRFLDIKIGKQVYFIL